MSTGRWSAFNADHEVRYNGDVSFLVITISKTSVVAKGLYWVIGWGIGVCVTKIRQEIPSA